MKCECGCGKDIISQPHHKFYPPKFINGHNTWKGDKVGYLGLHLWIKKYKPKLDYCEKCGNKGKTELANISGDYKRDINDFMWTCRKCNCNMNKGTINKRFPNHLIRNRATAKRYYKKNKDKISKSNNKYRIDNR